MADIAIARSLVSPKAAEYATEALNDAAAYHTQQAIEKELKYVLHDLCGVDDTLRSFRIHNLDALIEQVREFDIDIPADLISVAADITDWEASTRYSIYTGIKPEDVRKGIAVYDVLAAFVRDIAEKMVPAEEEFEP